MLAKGKSDEMEDLRRQEESRKIRILEAKEELADAVQNLKQLPPYDPRTNETVSCAQKDKIS